ncbi:MAG: glucose-6-phosphate isomerase, partial [Bacilli bacterium]
MKKLTFQYDKATSFFNEAELTQLAPFVEAAHNMIHDGTGAGSDFLGWVNLPDNYDQEEFARIQGAADRIQGA